MRPRGKAVTTGVAGVAGVALVAAGLLAVGEGGAGLSASGPVRVHGTTATATYPYADAVVREVRYVDAGRLSYEFTLANDGVLPVTVTGLERQAGHAGSLLRPRALERDGGGERFTVWPGDRSRVRLSVLMLGCERVSSRAGSLLEGVALRVNVAGAVPREADLALPERVHTGSPRDAECPSSSSATRSPG